MKKTYLTLICVSVFTFAENAARAQCASVTQLGSASNLFTIIRNGNNPVAAEKALNMITFIHRNDAASFGGNSGHLRYDISLNAGTTWTTNLGVLNPVNSNLARYPNMAIYNPALNTNPANAYVVYMAATINSLTSTWNGLVSGVQHVNGSGLTEFYNQPVQLPQLIPHSLVKGSPGIFWAIDPLYTTTYNGYAIYKGTWNSGSNDIVWTTNFTVAPTWNNFSGQDYNIAFDPTGQTGWFCINGHVSGGPTASAFYPTLWRTVNGGNTWTGPYTADLSKLACFNSFVNSPNVPSVNLEHDLVVDVNGNPHIFTTVMNSSSYALNYGLTHWMYDITLVDSLWAAYPVAVAKGGMATWGTGVDIAQMWLAPQAARTADGTKVFFTWADNSSYTTGAANTTPNLYTRAFDVVQNQWTQVKDVTSCNVNAAGKVLFPHLAPEVLEPANGVYKLAPVYAEFTAPNDPLQPVNFHFLDNVTYASSEFTVAADDASVSIAQGNPLLLCPGSTVAVTVPGAGNAYWNNGATGTIVTVSSATVSPLIVTAQKNCLVGKDTVTIANLTINATANTQSACTGDAVNVSVTGNASSYTWMPAAVTGTAVQLTAGSIPGFTLLAQGDGCVTQTFVPFTLLSQPTITILGPDTACANHVATYTATGAASYTWHNNTVGDTYTVIPSLNDSYSVAGTAANTCTNTQNISIVVIPSPTLIPSASHSVVCSGNSATLVVYGAQSYSWNTGSSTNINVVTPDSNSTYEATGRGINGCTDTHEFTVHVNPLPTLSVTSTKSVLCTGERAILTASGAVSYIWTGPVVATNVSISVLPQTQTNYIVKGRDANQCVNTTTFTQKVEACPGLREVTAEAQLMVYPNPATGAFTIRNPMRSTVKIFNQLGQLMYTYEARDFESGMVEVKDLRTGLYFVNAERQCIKVVIEE